MATVLYSDVNYYGPHLESMARQWRPFESLVSRAIACVVQYVRDESAKRYLRELPDYLLEDIGVKRDEL